MQTVFKKSLLGLVLASCFAAQAADMSSMPLPPSIPPLPATSALDLSSLGMTKPVPEIRNTPTLGALPSTLPASTPAKTTPKKPSTAALSEFQQLVKESIGYSLPVFGSDIFAQDAQKPGAIPVSADYVVGPGDEVVVKAWGSVDIEYRATVEPDGNVFIPKIGAVFVAGTKFSELNARMSVAIKKLYKNFELSVSMGQLRSVEVMVVGQAGTPGTYQLAPYSTVVNALAAAGGPTSKGSVRNIRIVRNGKDVAKLDAYDIVLKGDRSKDIRLQPGDVVVIPPATTQVALDGAVTNPAIYELKPGETLKELVGYAGGYAISAKTHTLRVERVSAENANREISEVRMAADTPEFALRDGDIVRVPRIVQDYSNAITLRGAVAEPARISVAEGTRISDVITNPAMLIEPGYWKAHNRAMSEKIDSEDSLAGGLKRSYEEINWDYAVIERLNRQTLEIELLPFNLGKALKGDPEQNLKLLPGDTLTVFSKQDVKVPMAKQTRFVRVEGEVNSPGVYLATPADTLQSLVKKAGGYTPQAYPHGAQMLRDSVRKEQQRRMADTLDKLEQAIEREARQRMSDAMTAEEVASGKADVEAQKQMVAKLRQVQASGRIVLEVGTQSKSETDLPQISLEDGDKLTIPATPSTVSVAGSVFNENSFIYRKDKSVSDYLAQAGGPITPSASHLMYLVRVDGAVVRASMSDTLDPGDSIIVVEEVGRKSFMRSVREWAQVFYQFGLGAAAIKVLK